MVSDSIDYYGYAPLVIPPRPIAVAGSAGARVGMTARIMSILTGLPLFLLDRAVEHRFGKGLKRAWAEEGPEAIHRVELELLERPLGQATPPVIALGQRTLIAPAARQRIVRGCTVVYIRAPLTPPDVHEVLSAVADLHVARAGRHERRVAQQVLRELDLDVPLPQ